MKNNSKLRNPTPSFGKEGVGWILRIKIQYKSPLIPLFQRGKRFIYFLFALSAFFLFPTKLALTASTLVINEIMYDLKEVADANHEWIELYNAGSSEIDLTGAKFNDGDDATNHALNPPPKNGSRGSLIIPAGGYLILTGNASTTILDMHSYNGSIIDTVMSLNNTAATLKILDKDGTEIASANYTKEMGASENGKTLSWDGTSFKESASDGGTPGEINTFSSSEPPGPSPSPQAPTTPSSPAQEEQAQSQTTTQETVQGASQSLATSTPSSLKNRSDKIFINEFLPWPQDGKEWVELVNFDSETIDLSGWQIDDSPEKSVPQTISNGTLIEPQKFLVIEMNKNVFNNDGDQIRLLWPDGQTIHSVTFENAKQGFSSSRFEAGLWLWTENPTPGQENKKPAPKVQTPAEPENQTSRQNETLAETQSHPQQSSSPPTAQTATTQTPPPEQPKINPLVEATKENATSKKSSQPINKAVSPENEIPDSPDLQAAIATPLQNQSASGRTKPSNPKILFSLAAILFLSLAAGLGLIYFKRKKTVDSKTKPS